MKEKNDFKNERSATPDVVEPIACLYCHHKDLERVQYHNTPYGNFINRLTDVTVVGILLPGLVKKHRLYGYRCLYCGYIMWFTARDLG